MLTPELLVAATGCTATLAERHCAAIAATCKTFDILTAKRFSAFIAQVGHESGGFRFMRELWGPTAAQKTYEGRTALGNTQPGDGERYLGRGPIQVTGRFNYRATYRGLQQYGAPDFEAEPEKLEDPHWGWLAAGLYWSKNGCNELADEGKFESITKRINGGLNGYDDRKARWEKAKKAIPDNLFADTKEPPVIPNILLALGGSLINAFAPLAKEKIEKELARHTDNHDVVNAVTSAVIETAKVVTGNDDPIEAVAAARKDPAIMAQVEASALDQLAKLAPLLERLNAFDHEARVAAEASMDAASKRAAFETYDMTKTLIIGALGLIGVLIVFVGAVAMIQLLKSDTIQPEVWAQIAGLIGFASGVGTTIYAYRFGSSRGSAAKDVVIDAFSRKR